MDILFVILVLFGVYKIGMFAALYIAKQEKDFNLKCDVEMEQLLRRLLKEDLFKK